MSDILSRAEEANRVASDVLARDRNRSIAAIVDAADLLPDLIAEIKQQAAYMGSLEKAYQEAEAACQYYEGCLLECEADDKSAFFGWPGRGYQATSDPSILDLYRDLAREALEKIRGEKE